MSHAMGEFQVSILIPAHNRIDLTAPCLESIYRHADPRLSVEIIVIDDASTDGTAEFIRKRYPDVIVVQNAQRRSFGANINAAAGLARGRYLCILNNDTLVLPNWLAPMMAAADDDPTIGVVGNRHLWPGGDKINHAGMAFTQRCEPVHIHVGRPRNFAPALVDREFQILTAACWLVPKNVFSELNGFDLQFVNGFEDVDFCLRARDKNLKVWYVGKSAIYHYGQSSAGRTENDTENARRLRRKWRGKIRPDLHEFTLTPSWRVQPKPKRMPAPAVGMSVADLHFAVPINAGNSFSWVTAQLAMACQATGMKVSLSPGKLDHTIEGGERIALRRMMSRAPAKKFQIRWTHFWTPYLNQELTGEINAEIFAINYRYGRQPFRSLDYWMRHTVVNPYRKLPISHYCRDMLTDIGVDQSCRVLPLGFSPEILSDATVDRRFADYRFVFLAVTNSHDPLRYGTDILLKSYQQAFAGRTDVVLVLKDYGNVRGPIETWVAAAAGAAPIAYLREFVSKRELIALYRRADAFVAPFRGEGFGMKIVDACALAIPVIAPHYGGPRDYLRPGSFYPVKYREIHVGDCLDAEEGIVPPYALWCEPDGDDLAAQMIAAAAAGRPGRDIAAPAQEFVLENHTWQHSAVRLTQALTDFSRERAAVVGTRASVVSKPLSIVMPTFRRPAELKKTLDAYQRQSAAKNDWELIVVDDGSGPEYNIADTVAAFASLGPIKLATHAVNSGQGKARETAIALATGNTILFTGDDIVPHTDLVATHIATHQQLRAEKAAVLGYIGWDKDIEVTELMDFVTAEGGHQFSYWAMVPYQPVRPDWFYTSNVSISRRFLNAQEIIFDPHFKGYGCEDSEFGRRLAAQGMKLYFNPDAYAFHNHSMSDEDIYRRQYNVGRSLVSYYLLQPRAVDDAVRNNIALLAMLQHAAQHDTRRPVPAAADESFTSIFARLGLNADAPEDSIFPSPATLAAKSRKLREFARSTAAARETERRGLMQLCLGVAEFCGMADEWLGPDAAPDRFELCALLLRRHMAWAPGKAVTPIRYGSDLERRIGHIESLTKTHPKTASALKTVVRLATSVAKRS